MERLRDVLTGWTSYISADKLIVLFLGGMLYLLLSIAGEKGKSRLFIIYACVAALLACIPLTAACLMLYQTRFYDYAWIWSMVPVTAGIAFCGTKLIWEEVLGGKNGLVPRIHRPWHRKLLYGMGIVVAVCLFALCGNLGSWQKTDRAESLAGEQATELLQTLEQLESDSSAFRLWGPKDLMAQIRRQSGEIQLLYGRDMWDGKAAAYDYEVYTTEVILDYQWMESLCAVGEGTEVSENDADMDPAGRLEDALARGVNLFVFPSNADSPERETLEQLLPAGEMAVEELQLDGYFVYWVYYINR